MLGQNQKFGEYTTLVNVSAKSTTLVNALAANGIGYHVSERIVGKPKPLIVDSLQTLSREEMSIQIRLTGHSSVDRPSPKAMQYGCLTLTFFSGLDLTEIDSYCTD